MRYYFGTPTVSLTIAAPVVPVVPVLPDWPLTLNAADVNGNVNYTVPALPAASYNAPTNIIAAYVPGATLDPTLTGDQVLALPGVVSVSTPFPPSFGIGLNQSPTVVVPGPLPVGPVVVVILGQFV